MTTHLAYRQISFTVVWQWQFDSPCVHVPATHRRSVCLPYGNAANVAAMATETAAAAATTSKATQQSNNQTTTTNYNISNLTLRLSHNVLVTHWSSLRSHLFSCELWRQFFSSSIIYVRIFGAVNLVVDLPANRNQSMILVSILILFINEVYFDLRDLLRWIK